MLTFGMLLVIISVLLFSPTGNAAGSTEHLIRIDEGVIDKLRISSDRLLTAVAYEEFELFNDYQCAIECIKDKSSCTGFAFDDLTSICSLFEDSADIINNDLTKVV